MKRYPEYKDSGVEWIGEIPKDWNAVPLTKYLESIIDYRGRTPEKTENGRFLVTAKNIRDGQIDYELSQEFTSEDEYQRLMTRGVPQIGDVLFTTEAPLGEVANVDDVSIALAQRIIKFRPKTDLLNPYFLKYWILSYSFQSDLQRYATGSTARGIKASKLCLLKLNLPPLKEQTQIVNFLDRKTEQIDELIRIKERKIELLQEQRTALINHAVTKGLDPHVEMKPSGVEWIGEIPKHWNITRLKYLGESIIGLTYKPENITDENNGTLVLRASNIKNGKPSFHDNVYVNSKVDEKLFVKVGDILICSRSGSRDLIGKNLTISENLVGATFGVFMTVFRTKYYQFISHFLNSQIFKNQSGLFLTSTVNQLTVNTLNNFFICLPKKEEEQIQIANFLDQKTEQIAELVSNEHRKIELLKEYRQSLISEAVTGKIDVRNEV